jgi:hydroxymethylpyrimidine/phosphomethylpyrimidine kinase
MKTVLTIAGSDSSGGAGIQADLKTMMAHKVYGMSVITALTAQNTTGVAGIMEVTPEFVAQQLDCVFKDIRPDAVKIGMVSNAAIIKVIADKLIEYKAENIVVDPVMVATSGSSLMQDDASQALRTQLLPLADVITPNVPEGEVLSGVKIETKADMLVAADLIASAAGTSVLLKGGHLKDSADDLLFMDGKASWFESERIENPNTHGTGCTLSSAIAANLALGHGMEASIRQAKAYITGALRDGLDLGKGSGPLNHAYTDQLKKKTGAIALVFFFRLWVCGCSRVPRKVACRSAISPPVVPRLSSR